MYVARLAQFGLLGIVGDGETREEHFSGRFVVRLPKFLHRELVSAARRNEFSLNQCVATLLASNWRDEKIGSRLERLESELGRLRRWMGAVTYYTEAGFPSVRKSWKQYFADEYATAA